MRVTRAQGKLVHQPRRSLRSRSFAATSSDLVELQLAGFACCPAGFVAVVAPRGTQLPPAHSKIEVLRGVEPASFPASRLLAVTVSRDERDRDAPTSPSALTLLQLAQQPAIDLGTVLSITALQAACGVPDGSLLGVVVLREDAVRLKEEAVGVASAGVGVPPSETNAAATLFASAAEGAGAPATGLAKDGFTALALYLRYASLGARLFAPASLLSNGGFDASELATRYPAFVAAVDVAAQGAAAAALLRRAFIDDA